MQECRLKDSPIVYYVSRCESADWVLFLHAAFVNHEMFIGQVDAFKDKYNILIPDIIGHGKSVDTRKGDSIDKMSLWISKILCSENIDKVHIVGVSLGAVLAQDFANKHPDFVRSLACFGGYDINNFDPDLQKENSSKQMLMMMKAMFSVKWFAKANMKISAYTAKAQQDFYNMNITFPKKSFMHLSSLNSMVNSHSTGTRAYPLLIGCGRQDIPSEIDAVEMWKKAEPNCKVMIFEGAGHCVNMDVPEKFGSALQEFWNG